MLTPVVDWAFPTSSVNREARAATHRTLRIESLMRIHRFTFYMKLKSWENLSRLSNVPLRLSGTAADPFNTSKRTIFQIPLTKCAFDMTYDTRWLKNLRYVQELEQLFLISYPDLQRKKSRSNPVLVEGYRGFGNRNIMYSNHPQDMAILQAYFKASSTRTFVMQWRPRFKHRVLEKPAEMDGDSDSSDYDPDPTGGTEIKVQVMRWQQPEDLSKLQGTCPPCVRPISPCSPSDEICLKCSRPAIFTMCPLCSRPIYRRWSGGICYVCSRPVSQCVGKFIICSLCWRPIPQFLPEEGLCVSPLKQDSRQANFCT
jgi:hypothetical protein